MLNHTYTSIKNADLVDSGNKQHIASQPSILLKNNFLGEFRTELEKKKVLANLGIVTDLLLEWEFIKGDIGKNEALMKELDTRTSYVSLLDGFKKTLADGLKAIEEIIKGEQDVETGQDDRITELETKAASLTTAVNDLKTYLSESVDVDISQIKENVSTITEKVNNITELIKVSSKSGNALSLVGSEDLTEGETPGLYVPDLSNDLTEAQDNIQGLRTDVDSILDTYVTKDELGGGDFDFVNQSEYDTYTQKTDTAISDIKSELSHTVKTGEDGHVDTLYVNKISKNNNDDNIKISDSFEVESGIPLDVRFVVESLDELCALPAKVCYAGMGVIVNSISSLYILRKPEEGIHINQDYIGNIYNWKCPEDLVTVALSREEYENLEEVNPNVFYYIYEEEIKRTQEPKPEEFGSTEEYEKAFADWVNSLKTLSQEYMSASWGVDIENKLGKKANQVAVNALNNSIKGLQDQINSLSGGDSENSLSALSERLTKTESELDFLLGTEGTDEEPSSQGKITEIEESISSLDNKVTEQYVSIESITSDNDDTAYIFVKKSEYAKDVEDRDAALKEKLETETIKASTVDTTQINIAELPVTSNGTNLLVDSKEVALVQDVPKITYLTQVEYDALVESGELDPDTYYYTTNEEIYVTKTDFDAKVTQLNTQIKAANTAINMLSTTVQEMQTTIETLLSTIDTLQNRLDALEGTHEEGTEELLT